MRHHRTRIDRAQWCRLTCQSSRSARTSRSPRNSPCTPETGSFATGTGGSNPCSSSSESSELRSRACSRSRGRTLPMPAKSGSGTGLMRGSIWRTLRRDLEGCRAGSPRRCRGVLRQRRHAHRDRGGARRETGISLSGIDSPAEPFGCSALPTYRNLCWFAAELPELVVDTTFRSRRRPTRGCLVGKRESAPIPAGCSDEQQAPLAGEADLRFGAAVEASISDFSPSRPP